MKLFKDIILFGLTIGIILLAFEVYLYLGELVPPKYREIHSELGLKFVPNQKITRFTEGFYMGSINKMGYLGPVVDTTSTTNEIRVAMLGDSYLVGQQVFYRDHYACITNDNLNKIDNYKLLNFGMNGYGLGDMYVRYVKSVKSYVPRLTLFFISPNDLVYQSGILNPQLGVHDNKVIINPMTGSNESVGIKTWIEKSRLWSILGQGRLLVNKGKTLSILFGKFGERKLDAEHYDLIQNGNDSISDIDSITYKVLEQFKKESNIGFVLLKPFKEVDKRILKEMEFPVIDLEPLIRELESKGIEPSYWKGTGQKGHYNQNMHKEIAVVLTKLIPELIEGD